MTSAGIFGQKRAYIDTEDLEINAPICNLNGNPVVNGVGAFGSTPNATGLVNVGGLISLEPADSTHPGGLSLTAQTIVGAKTFSSTPIFTTGKLSSPTLTMLQQGPDPTTVFVGGAGNGSASGTYNVGVGPSALGLVTTGHICTAVGEGALANLLTGTNNEALGQLSGSAYTGAESNNLCLSNTGVIGDSGVIRIGRNTFHTSCFIQGVDGVTVTSGVECFINASGQLGTTSSARGTKRDITAIPQEDVDKVLSLPMKKFKYIADKSNENHFGSIAEDADEIMKDIVVHHENGKPKNIQYHKLVPILTQIAQNHQNDLKAMGDSIKLQHDSFISFKEAFEKAQANKLG